MHRYWAQFSSQEILSMYGIEEEIDPSHDADEMDLETINYNHYSNISDIDMLTWRDFL